MSLRSGLAGVAACAAAACAPTQAAQVEVRRVVATPRPVVTPAPPPVIASALAGRASSCVHAESRRGAVSVRPDQPLAPASAQKVLVAAAALSALGPHHTFTTSVVAAGDRLWLVGGADPFLATTAYTDGLAADARYAGVRTTSMSALADSVVASGVRAASAVDADASRHDGAPFLDGWKPVYASEGSVPPLSALVVDGGWTAWSPRRVAGDDPARHAARTLASMLRERGVDVAGEPEVAPAPPHAQVVARAHSAPLATAVAGMLSSSDNLAAELLVREVGLVAGSGTSTPGGIAAVQRVLEAAGVASGVALRDGSGLDPDNRVTCRALVEALRQAPDVVRGLAVAGRTGTLHNRFRGTAMDGVLRAKTGWIGGVVSIAGVLRDTTFAIVQNDVPSLRDGRRTEELVLAELASL